MKLSLLFKERAYINLGVILGGISGIFISFLFCTYICCPQLSICSESPDTEFMLIAKAVDQIERTSYKEVDLKETIYSGIHGMLRTLDPYSTFLDESAFKYMAEQQEGSFFGIGISFDIRNGELLVVAPIEGSPAWELGIKAGDIIVKINGESTAGITTAEVLKKLRGKKNSKVNVSVKRPGNNELRDFEIVRDRIELNSVRGGFLIDNLIGYIRLTEFSATTASDLKKMILDLQKEGLGGIILDLRFNGGGLLAAAEDVSSLFLKKDQLIVSTQGRNQRTGMELKCKSDGIFKDLPVIVLINQNSASSSEIVAGAIQDHDRGLVLGTTSHGKGLVGSQYRTKFDTAVQVTTAQYFTPSGRCIQRPYDIPHRKYVGKSPQKNNDNRQDKEVYFTDNRRKVFGGGGIQPDVEVEEPILSRNMFILENGGYFFDFAVKNGENRIPGDDGFVISEDIYNRFIQFCRDQDVELNADELDQDNTEIRTALLREFKSIYINPLEGQKVRVKNSLQVQEALKLFAKIDQLLHADSENSNSEVDQPGLVDNG